jgi:putative ABC transport system permease protein
MPRRAKASRHTALTSLAVALSRVRALVTGRRLDVEFNEELESHLALLADDLIRRGLSPEAAQREARLRLGGVAQLEEAQRDARSLPMIETTLQDVRYALRSLRKNPAFAAVAIATLAIGIGAGAAVYTVVGAVLLRPLPFREPGQLVQIFETNPLRRWTRNIVAPANWADWRTRNKSFTDIAAYEQFSSNGSGAGDVFLTGVGEPQGLKALGVSGNLFQVLGATPLMGRTFLEEEQWEGKSSVVVLSYGLWQTAFGGDPSILGKKITLSGRTYEVVGVMPRAFFFPGRDVQLWTPLGYTPQRIAMARRPHYLGAVARRRPSVSFEQARDDMATIARQLEQQYPDTNTQMGVLVEPLHDAYANKPRTALLMLSGAVGLLFLIVCANIANLQLGRGVSRTRELAIRRALGAGRGRLLRQLLTESLVLSAAGGVLGFGLAAAAKVALTRYAAAAIPLFADVQTDRGVLLFTTALSLLAPVIFGVVPAFSSSRSGQVTERTESVSRATRSLRGLLVAGEVALSIVLVVGAVLLVRSLARLQDVDPGFNQEHAITFTMTLPSARYADAASRFRAFTEIERRLSEQPGVQAVGATSALALRGYTWTGDTTIEGRTATDYERDSRHMSTTPSYFSTMGIRLLAGRWFDYASDTREKPQITIVNESLARRYFRGLSNEAVVGKRIAFGRPQDNSPWVTIVGVVADEKQDGLDRPAEPTEYSSIGQRQQNPMTFVVRTTVDPEAAIAAARAQVRGVDKDLALTEVATLKDVVSTSMADVKFRTTLLSGFAGIALLLAALGIYGVLAYFVSQRAREIGIRLALGATPREVFHMVVRQGMLPVLVGAALGIGIAIPMTTLLRTLLFEVEPIDPPTYAIALTALVAVSLAACALPARRATRVDPLVALRDE